MDAFWEAIDNIWRKIQLFCIGFLHLLFSSDHLRPRQLEQGSSYPSLSFQNYDAQDVVKTRKKKILFVRHAESEWNVVFNRGGLLFAIFRFFQAIGREWLLLPTFDSIFIDSPLSNRGIRQCKALYQRVSDQSSSPEYIPNPPYHSLRYLGCQLPNSVIVSSNLRRAIDTARIVSASRLALPNEKIHILSSLQEIGRNLDTLAISEAHEFPPSTLSTILQGEKHEDELYNLKENHGNKSVHGYGLQRMNLFVNWIFCRQEDTIIVYGHSHWFRAFCQEYFPSTVNHDAKTIKLANCGVVSFDIQEFRSSNTTQYQIQPETFQYIC